jgi:hypothetical protein
MFARDAYLQLPALHETVTSAANRPLEAQSTEPAYQLSP